MSAEFEQAWERIKDDTSFSSRTIDAIRHPCFKVFQEAGVKALPWLLELLKTDNKRSPHLMGIIFNVAGEDAPEIPIEHRGFIRIMEKIILEWGVKRGYIKEEGKDAAL